MDLSNGNISVRTATLPRKRNGSSCNPSGRKFSLRHPRWPTVDAMIGGSNPARLPNVERETK